MEPLVDDVDDDIYSGVVDTDASAQRVRELEAQLLAARQRADAARVDTGALRGENAALRARVKALESNISCLYKTAVAEIARKDALVQSLRAYTAQ